MTTHATDDDVDASLTDFVRNSSFLIQRTAPDGRLTFVNDAWKATLGYDDDTAVGLLLADVVAPEFKERCEQMFRRVLDGQVLRDVEAVLLARDGRRVILSGETSCRFVGDVPVETRGIFRDVTLQREAEAHARAAAVRYAATVVALGFGVAVLDAGGIVESLNPMGEQLLGISVANVVGRSLIDLNWRAIRADGTPLARADHPALVALRTERRQEDILLGLVRPTGEVAWLEVSAEPLFRAGEARPYAVVASFRDVTRRRRAEAALSTSEARFRAVAECLGVGLVLTDLDDHALYVNRRMSEMTGYSRERLITARLGDVLLPPDRAAEFASRTEARRRGEADCYEVEHVRADGSRFWAEISGAPYRDDAGVIVGTVGTVTDVSERKTVETMKAQLVGVVSHELRTPLGAIASALAILSRSLVNLEPRPAQMLEMATRNTRRLLDLVARLLDVERLEAGVVPLDLAVCAAADLIGDVCELLRPIGEDTGVRIVAGPAPGYVLADADRLRQCLVNLVGNAIKFSPPGGAITVGACAVGPEVQFSVRDEGAGIAAPLIAGLFNRFVQVDSDGERRRKGAGLGLVISRAIVEQHGGRIWVESEVGKGSTFCFTARAADVPSVTEEAA